MANIKDAADKIQSFVLFDTETTGLPSVGNNTRMTELCFLALTREELMLQNQPVRVVNKLCLCFNPMKRISLPSVMITGLHNDALEKLAPFKQQASLICQFLQNLPKPVCLVAHNGNNFDFPLLLAQLKASSHDVPQEVLCADSLEAFRAFDGLSPVPEFVCKRSKNNNEYTTESTSSTSLKNGSLANSEEQLENRVEECAETQDPNGDVETTSFHGKRLHECGGKHTEYNGTTGSGSGATHWEASGESTPVKKMARLEPGPPTKQSVSPHGLEAGFRQREADVRQNLFGSSPYISGGEDSQQTVAYSQSGAAEGTDPSEPETNGQARQKGAGLKCHRELFPLEEPDAKSESSSQPDFSSNLSSLSEDSEKLLLEAVQQAEQAEAGMLNTGSVAGGDQAMLSSKETGQTLNKTPCPPKVNGSVNPKHSPGRADNSGGKPQKVSYSLPKIYMRLFGQEPPASHEAEDDCRTLLKVIQASSKNTFPHWCDQNAVSLSSIEPMY